MRKKQVNTANNSLDLIIFGGNNQICVNSRDIAKEFGRQHKNVLQTIDELLADDTISWLEAKLSKYNKRGKEYRCYELTEAGFLKAMPFIGGSKAKKGPGRRILKYSQMFRKAVERT
jgi:Rha family phage regulatory protein